VSVVASVLLPVRDGRRTLGACLDGWLAQRGIAGDWEIVAVDNGSTDGSDGVLEALATREPRLRLYREARPGQSAASNRAAAEARGRLLVFSAQDMLVEPDFLAGHLAAHAKRGRPGEALLLIGHIDYPPACLATPFMRCLVEETAFQFDFSQVGDPEDADPRCCYAPNISLAATVFRRLGGFDEAFPYGWQDTDLGFRLKALPGRLIYAPGLRAWHDHPVEGAAYCARMEAVGRDAPAFADKHPGVLDGAALAQATRAHFLEGRRLASAAQRLIKLSETEPGLGLPPLDVGDGRPRDALHAAWTILLKYRFHKGVHDGARLRWGPDWLDLLGPGRL
jgi:GT2 family glycosyltransferase